MPEPISFGLPFCPSLCLSRALPLYSGHSAVRCGPSHASQHSLPSFLSEDDGTNVRRSGAALPLFLAGGHTGVGAGVGAGAGTGAGAGA